MKICAKTCKHLGPVRVRRFNIHYDLFNSGNLACHGARDLARDKVKMHLACQVTNRFDFLFVFVFPKIKSDLKPKSTPL